MDNDNSLTRYILGVNAGLHDSSAALLRNGELVAMAEQERLSRRKHAFFESPGRAITACLDHAGIDLEAVAEIAIGWDIPLLMEYEKAGRFDEKEFTTWLLGDAESAGEAIPPLRFVDHHLAHAASTFYTSGFTEGAILIADGRGESVATTLAVGGPGGIEVLESWGIDSSLGFFYAMAAEWAGMRMRDAGKLMGLAAYGEPCQPVPLAVSAGGYTIEGAPDGDLPGSEHFAQLRKRLRSSFQRQNYPFGPGDPAEIMAHADFAASIQHALEGVLVNLARIARKESGYTKLAVAGGVALNCTANGAISRSGIFDEVWIPPFPHDTGVSLGAAFVADRERRHSPRTPSRLEHPFWAPAVAAPDAATLGRLSDCEVDRHDGTQLADVVARHIEEGKLVGWYQGRAEVGQRALGARSILCDPRSRQALVRANLAKGRETWRPLAPAVLADRADAVFDGSLPVQADFMLVAWPVREAARPRLPAAVHVDGSARPQLVRPGQRHYHDVIHAFCERTGVPALINTSFNLAGEPIVHSASDAIETFLKSGLDVLILDDLVALKPQTEAPKPAHRRKLDPDMGFSPPWVKNRVSRQ